MVFEGQYVNNIVEGNSFGKVANGNVTTSNGRKGFALSLDPNGTVNLGT